MASITRRSTSDGSPRYVVRWRADGSSHQHSFARRQDADAFRRKVEADELVGLVTDLRAGAEALGPFADRWLSTRLVRGRPLAPMTLAGYRGLLRRNISPELGGMALRKLTPETVRAWHARLSGQIGSDAAAKSYRLLRAILNTAVDDDLIARNPCRIKGGGTERPSERPLLEVGVVLDLAEVIEPRYRALVLLACLGGLRTGELLGLRRCDVDLLRRVVHVRQQAQEVPRRGRVVTDPKSEAGRRSVVLPTMALQALDVQLATYAQPGPDGAIFTGPEGGTLRRATLSAAWRQAKAAAGLDPSLRLHDLRHHAATQMARMPGITTRELMARIGHASPRAALIYQHATEERDRAVADFLDTQLAGVERPRTAPVVSLPRARRVPEGTSSAIAKCQDR